MIVKLASLLLVLSVEISISQIQEVRIEGRPTSTYETPNTTTETPLVPTTTVQPDPPPKNETARMARYIVHYSDWCVLAHISHHGNTSGFPAARVFSTADGWYNTSTGTPYFYVSKMDVHINDLSMDTRCSVTMSLVEGNYCHKNNLDPEDPRCAQVIFTGKFVFLDPEDPEWHMGRLYLLQRHPAMNFWPKDHSWNVAKMKIGHIQVADDFGGSVYPSVEDYFKANL